MAGPQAIQVTNPGTGEVLGEVPDAGYADTEAAVQRARAAQPAWAALPIAERAAALRRLGRALRDDGALIDTLVAESGKPRYEAEAIELFYLLELTRFFTGRAGQRALHDERRRPFLFRTKRTRVVYHPRGVVGVIGPWNWPLLNNFADCVAPLLAGNAVVLKPSEWTPLTSLAVEKTWLALGLPAGVFQVVTGRGPAGAALTQLADMIFFTGSQAVGRQVARTCGERLVPVVCELGGNSPMIVLADADLKRAAHAAAWGAFAHSGQVCVRVERVLVEANVAPRFVELLTAEVRRLRQGPTGNRAQADFDVGAITFPRQIAIAEDHITEAVARGARVVIGGKRRTDLPGRFFEPTILADVTPDMRVAREETFAPVLPVIMVKGPEEAVAIANDGPYGLAASVWSRDAARARALARRLEVGGVCLNDVLVNYFSVESPLGGVKGSGLGFRHGVEGLRQFCRIESILEDSAILGRLSGLVTAQLTFPYRARTLAFLRWFMRKMY